MSRQSVYQQLRSHLAYLGLAAAAEALPGQLEKARQDDIGHTEFVEQLLRIEVEATRARRWRTRMKFANFPTPWTLEDFDFAAQPGVDPKLISELAGGAYVEDAANVIFIGPPGATQDHAGGDPGALGNRLRLQGLLRHRGRSGGPLPQGRIGGTLGASTMNFFSGPSLLIIDELGYLPMPAEDAAALFQVISRRYGKGSVIVTLLPANSKA